MLSVWMGVLPIDEFEKNARSLHDVVNRRIFRSHLSPEEIVENGHDLLSVFECHSTQVIDHRADQFLTVDSTAQLRDITDRWLAASISWTKETILQCQQCLMNILDRLKKKERSDQRR